MLNHSIYQTQTGKPIHNIQYRIKKKDSLEKKLELHGFEPTYENAKDQLQDIAGIRIICYFAGDVNNLVNMLKKQPDLIFIQERNYIENPKPNGYRSYHMIVEIPVFFSKGKTPMRVELQIRTNGMDFWATLEHQLRYKKGIEDLPGYDEISEELLRSAQAVIETDNEMQSIKNKIGMFHDI